MNLPGFTATAALTDTERLYRMAGNTNAGNGGAIVPALEPGFNTICTPYRCWTFHCYTSWAGHLICNPV